MSLSRGRVLDAIGEIYDDAPRCAELAGLHYVHAGERGIRRRRCGRGFAYRDARGQLVDDKVVARIAELAIPPAWRDVWIGVDARGHLLATGEDDRGRTQYVYHPKWSELRGLLNFYRLLVFGEQLPTIRQHVAAQLRRRTLDRDRVLATMLRIVDTSAVRIGTEVYADENDSFGLSTLTKRHVRVHASSVEFDFPAKSGRRVQTTIVDAPVARTVRELQATRGRHLFTVDGQVITAADVNERVLQLTGEHVTAKDFRTWNGTLAAFCHLRDQRDSDRAPERVAVDAIDEAAHRLDNTRAVARAHYVHPHMLDAFTRNRFEQYLDSCTVRRSEFLDEEECALLAFLRVLLEREFDQHDIAG
ncbi:MAG TPA: DNA topoisomerase IB [Jatrophihabitantaceae bacterium]